MKKRNILAGALLMACCCASAQETYQVSGHLDGLKSDSIIVMVQSPNFMRTERMDTVAMKNGDFAFNVADDCARMIVIAEKPAAGQRMSFDPSISTVALPGEQLILKGTLDEYTVDGSQFFQEMKKVQPTLDEASKEFGTLRENATKRMEAGEIRDSVVAWYQGEAARVMAKMSDYAMEYIKANPDNELSAYLITTLEEGKMQAGIDLLTDRVKQGVMAPYVKTITDMLEAEATRAAAAEKVKEGMMAPDFTLNDLQGKPLTLSSLRGKYVVLDFWGSWCGWCIKGFPEMKTAYAKYKGKVEFLGIACRDTEKRWRDAVAKHELPWLNVINSDDTDVSAMYAIQGYPTKLVIDPEGKIAKVVVGESPEFYEYLAKLFE